MNDMNNNSIIHYHCEGVGKKKYYPASKMVYDILGGIDWMACIGVIGDYGGKPWKEFINKTHEKYGYPPCEDENCFDSPFTKYDHLINAARSIRRQLHQTITSNKQQTWLTSKNPDARNDK
jgi:hypothetical protein